MTDYEAIKALFEKLEKGTDPEDPDYKAAKEDGMIDNIKDIFTNCYSAADFLKWLTEHNFDLFVDYRFANKTNFEEIAQELDNGNDRPEGVYNCDLEEWQVLEDEEDRKEYILNHLDCLMYSADSGVVVVSW